MINVEDYVKKQIATFQANELLENRLKASGDRGGARRAICSMDRT